MVLNVQSILLIIDRCMVIPLRLLDGNGLQIMAVNPTVEVGYRHYALVTQEMSPIPISKMLERVGELKSHANRVTKALFRLVGTV